MVAGGLESGDVVGEWAWVEPAQTSEARKFAVDGAGESGARDGLHVVGGTAVGDFGEDRSGEWVFAAGFETGRDREDIFGTSPAGGDDFDDGGLVSGECAGLVERDGSDGAEGLECGAAFDDHPEFACCADGGDDGDRHGDRERAR